MRDALPTSSSDDYDWPQQPWQCGLADEGPPCPWGPGAGGHCPQAAACRPIRDGDRWRCNRSAFRGGPCAAGPGPEGECAIVYRCTPVRTLRARRGRFVGAIFAAAVGAAAMILSGPWRDAWLAPGPLTRHHAQLIAAGGGAEGSPIGCAACHAAGGTTLATWWKQTTGTAAPPVSQTSLCLRCHAERIAESTATVAHNLPRLVESVKPAAAGVGDGRARRRDPHEAIACAACHREHQGAGHDLTTMSDAACQACHKEVFHSLATDHPDFGGWPYEERTGIAFDHASHQTKHFPAGKREFACETCHAIDAGGEVQPTASYAAACASCHDQALTVSLGRDMPIVALPTIDVEALAAAGHAITDWPAAATGDFEGTLPAPMQLLLAADPDVAAALETLGPRFDFFDLDVNDASQTAAAAKVLHAAQELFADITQRQKAAVEERLAAVMGREPRAPELAQSTMGIIFLNPPATAMAHRPEGHDDQTLRAWLDAYAAAADGPGGAIARPLLEAVLKPTAPGQCGSCHRLVRDEAGHTSIAWRAEDGAEPSQSLTRFSHGPHLTDASLRDCAACHVVNVGGARDVDDPSIDFKPLVKETCATCHRSGVSGESCTLCHAYHGGGAFAFGGGVGAAANGSKFVP